MASNHAPSKPHLARLFYSLSFFYPDRNLEGKWTGKFLVDQKKVDQFIKTEAHLNGETSCPPDRDDLLHLIGQASIELKQFTQEHDTLKDQIASFVSDSMLMHEEIGKMIKGLPEDMPMLEQVMTLVGRYRQIFDLITNLGRSRDFDEFKDKVSRFLLWKGIRVESLVNQRDAIDLAWGLIASASEGDWSKQSTEWVKAAENWRDTYLTSHHEQEAKEPKADASDNGPIYDTCQDCSGTGVFRTTGVRCSNCKGSGIVYTQGIEPILTVEKGRSASGVTGGPLDKPEIPSSE